jgi:hypothetical protein
MLMYVTDKVQTKLFGAEHHVQIMKNKGNIVAKYASHQSFCQGCGHYKHADGMLWAISEQYLNIL